MKRIVLFLFILTVSCTDGANEGPPPRCTVYQQCIGDLEGRYCTNGNKFGENSQFGDYGVDREGPMSPGMEVSYSFQTSGTYPTVFFGSFTSRPFTEIGDFAKENIRKALAEWESHINITFVETDDQENSILKLICADIDDKAGIGYSRCTNTACVEMEGFVFFKNRSVSEEEFYSLALHEIGHSLGLCHSSPRNIMAYNSNAYAFDELQAGDIEGIISIYGAR